MFFKPPKVSLLSADPQRCFRCKTNHAMSPNRDEISQFLLVSFSFYQQNGDGIFIRHVLWPQKCQHVQVFVWTHFPLLPLALDDLSISHLSLFGSQNRNKLVLSFCFLASLFQPKSTPTAGQKHTIRFFYWIIWHDSIENKPLGMFKIYKSLAINAFLLILPFKWDLVISLLIT